MAREPEAGITIVEIVISLVLLGIVLSAFLGVMVNGLRALTDSGQRQVSSQQATEVLEVLRAKTPSEIALYDDPLVTDAAEVDLTTITNCTASVDDDGDGTIDRTPAGYDPDGAGPLPCEELRALPSGAITAATDQPYFGTEDGVTVQTVATRVAEGGVQNGLTRVTVVLTYQLPEGVETVRRQSLFSEVSRG